MAYRDTFKYRFLAKDGEELHCGITYDLGRREGEHRRHFREPDGYIEPVGRRTSRAAAESWERRHGCSPYGRGRENDGDFGEVVGAAATGLAVVGAFALGVKLLDALFSSRNV